MLADIGNTTIHLMSENGEDWKLNASHDNIKTIKERCYYINVNPLLKETLETLPNWVDLAPYTHIMGEYEGMGIDRKVSCYGIDNGIIVDAGSAITVDVMQEGRYEGGFIYPGLIALQKSYASISSVLDKKMSLELSIEKLPKDTTLSISYGAVISLVALVERLKKSTHQLYLTGGDALKLSHLFKECIVDEKLIFSHMQKIIKEQLC